MIQCSKIIYQTLGGDNVRLNEMSKEELELYSYKDLAKMILEEDGKSLNTRDLFKNICNLLQLSDEEYANKIGDFYTSLTTDKTFILLENGEWDLSEHHSTKVTLDDEDIEDEDDLTETEEIIEDEMDDMAPEEIDDIPLDDDLDDLDDDDDLTVIDEDELDK